MAVTTFAQNGLVRLAYEIHRADGPTVLVLHGLLADRVSMRPLIDALEDRATVIAMDVRGHGGSSAIHGVDLSIDDLATDVLAVMDAAEISQPVTLVGVDVGAIVADRVWLMQSQRIRATIFLNMPSATMMERETLSAIADQAYKGQIEPAVNRWLDLAWGDSWRETVPKPRVAAARRSAQALHPILTALVNSPDHGRRSDVQFAGGMPFADDEVVNTVVNTILAPSRKA